MNLILFNLFTCFVITIVITPYVSGQNSNCPCGDLTTEYVLVNQKVPWFQAYALCKLSDMKLATITSAEEESAVEKVIHQYEPNNNGYGAGYWLGGARQGRDFIWLPSHTPLTYRKFHPAQPDSLSEGCLEIYFDNPTNLVWNDLGCESQLYYICQQSTCCGLTVP